MRLFASVLALLLTVSPASSQPEPAPYLYYFSEERHAFIIERADGTESRLLGQGVIPINAVGAEIIQWIRDAYPEHFFLVPGVGAQGGDLDHICRVGVNKKGGLLINASRSILYAGNDHNFAEEARKEASKMQAVMKNHII